MELITIENNTEPNNITSIQKINNNIIRKKPVVIYFYMDGCPYCVTTTNEWNQIPNHISREKLDDELLAIRINRLLFTSLNNVGQQPQSFPNIRYIHGNSITHYDKEGVERNAPNLAKWIEDKQSKKLSIIKPIKSYQPITRVIKSYQPITPIKKSPRKIRKNRKSKNRKSKNRKSKNRKSTKRKINNIPLHM